jgi:hypothetical protein
VASWRSLSAPPSSGARSRAPICRVRHPSPAPRSRTARVGAAATWSHATASSLAAPLRLRLRHGVCRGAGNVPGCRRGGTTRAATRLTFNVRGHTQIQARRQRPTGLVLVTLKRGRHAAVLDTFSGGAQLLLCEHSGDRDRPVTKLSLSPSIRQPRVFTHRGWAAPRLERSHEWSHLPLGSLPTTPHDASERRMSSRSVRRSTAPARRSRFRIPLGATFREPRYGAVLWLTKAGPVTDLHAGAWIARFARISRARARLDPHLRARDRSAAPASITIESQRAPTGKCAQLRLRPMSS